MAAVAVLLASPAMAQEEPIGPCSPYRAAGGDIPSEMPGCARHRRPAPGSLDDELAFRRGRHGAARDESVDDEDAPPLRKAARPR